MDFMKEEMEERMKRFLFKRTYESALVREKDTSSLLNEIIDYGVEKMAEENPSLAAMFPLKLCAMSKDDIGLMLADAMIKHAAGGDITVIECKREMIEKMFKISGGVMSFYGREIIPKDLKMKINFKGIGGTHFYGSSPEGSDLPFYEDGFKGHISIEDGEVSYALGLAEDAEHEVSGPSRWIMNLLFGAVDSSEIKEKGVRECVEYMEEVLSKIATTFLDGYPQYVWLKEEWFSRIKDGWNSDDGKVESLKAKDAVMLMDIINIPPATVPGNIMEDIILAKIDPAVKRGVVEEGRARILFQWKDGKVDMRILKPEEEVSYTFTVMPNYEELTRMVTGESSFLYMYKYGDLKIVGPGENVLLVIEGIVHLFHEMFDGTLVPIVRRSIKG